MRKALGTTAVHLTAVAAVIVATAGLLDGVSASPLGVVTASVVVTLPATILARALWWLRSASAGDEIGLGRGCAMTVTSFAGVFSPLALVPFAARVAPGFEVSGIWSYAATIALVIVLPTPLLLIAWARHRRDARRGRRTARVGGQDDPRAGVGDP